MYNRYIPQPDGSYRRDRIPDPVRQPPVYQPPTEECPPTPTPTPECEPSPAPPPRPAGCPKQGCRADGFLQQLLPKDFDTGDLIVVLLLLLMAGESQEGRNNALLTLALYFLM